TVGSRGSRELVGDEEVAKPLCLHRVPELVFLRAGDAVDATGPVEQQRLDERFGSGHLSAFLPKASLCGLGGQGGEAYRRSGLEQFSAREGEIHGCPPWQCGQSAESEDWDRVRAR